jgi:hydrogenase expression/formation protein HypC
MTSSSEAVGHMNMTSSSEAVGHISMTSESPLLPLAGVPAAPSLGTPAACSIDDDGCITCGDVAVALTVVEPGDHDAVCRDGDGRDEMVATELVGPVVAGDVLLVHAKVALEKLVSGGAGPPRVSRNQDPRS